MGQSVITFTKSCSWTKKNIISNYIQIITLHHTQKNLLKTLKTDPNQNQKPRTHKAMPTRRFSSEKSTLASVVEIPGLIHKTTILSLLGPNRSVVKQQICKEVAKMSKYHLSAKISVRLPQRPVHTPSIF